MSKVRHLTVTEDDNGQRLDRWLKRHVPDLPYGLAQKLIRQGQIRVDSKRAKPETRLAAGQDIRIPPIEEKSDKAKKGLSEKKIEFIRSLVIYDDGDVIALNKPYNLSVQGGTKTEHHIDGLLDGLKDKKGVRPRLVHRLDKDTSGVLLLARSAEVARRLGDAFKGRDIKKIYWAIVTPAPEMQQGTIRAPLGKSGGANKEKIVVDKETGKYAVTEFSVIEHAHKSSAFIAFWPRTGRTHQIRVHAQLMGCPILGDRKYGNPETGVEGLDHAGRLHLHAHRIICRHPVKKGLLDVKAPLPKELLESWRALGFSASHKADPFADFD